MFIQTFGRCSVALSFVALIAGCSSNGLWDLPSDDVGRANECKWNRSSCMYEGRYEPGERDYAEQEARRLNKAASEKLRRNAIN